MRIQLQIFADYFQFYLQDEKASDTGEALWNGEEVEQMIALQDGLIGIMTARNMDVPLTIDILGAEPATVELEEFDQVNECSIQILSGKMVVMGCTDYLPKAQRIELPNGWYRVRVGYKDLTQISKDGLEGEDSYWVQIWKEEKERPLRIWKQKIM